MTNEVSREQEYYWTRFAAFATLQAGFLVLVTVTVDADSSTAPTSSGSPVASSTVLAWMAMVVSAVWVYVQWCSRHYIERLNPEFRRMRGSFGFKLERHVFFGRRFLAATDAAMLAPVAVLVWWIIFISH